MYVEELGLWSLGDSRTAKQKLKLIMTGTEKLHVQGVRLQESCGIFFPPFKQRISFLVKSNSLMETQALK